MARKSTKKTATPAMPMSNGHMMASAQMNTMMGTGKKAGAKTTKKATKKGGRK